MRIVGVSREGLKGSMHAISLSVEEGEREAFKIERPTWYQIPLIAFLVLDPLRNPRVSGKPTATTGFLGRLRRNSGRLGDMMSKSKS